MSNVLCSPPVVNSLPLGRHTIKIPGNGISSPGIDAINQQIADWYLPALPDDWLWDWRVAGKGEYVGTLPKRIGKWFYQEHSIKLVPDQLTVIGNLGSQHCPRTETYEFDIVDRIDWSAGDFGDSGSCYWSCHASARDMILDNGGGAIRFFDPGTHDGIARAWIVPRPDGCLLVFNGYGMETLPIVRIVAAHLDHAYYRQVKLRNNGASDGALWINGSTGYLVGPQSVVTTIDAIDLGWEDPDGCVCECECCGDRIDPEDRHHSPDGEDYCESCYSDRVFYCESCNEDCWIDDSHTDPSGDLICDSCHNDNVRWCEHCNADVWESEAKEDPDGDVICESCHSDNVVECVYCDAEIWKTAAKEDPDGDHVCDVCFSDRFAYCDDCREVIHAETSLCDDCRAEEEVTV